MLVPYAALTLLKQIFLQWKQGISACLLDPLRLNSILYHLYVFFFPVSSQLTEGGVLFPEHDLVENVQFQIQQDVKHTVMPNNVTFEVLILLQF